VGVPVGDDTYAYRRILPHLSKPDRTYYVTFCTYKREILPPPARSLVMRSCTYDHQRLAWIDCVVVMHDHVHLIASPYETTSITKILERVKGASAHRVNRLLARSGTLWQRESFDRMVRSEESLTQKRAYIFDNPVRKGLVARWEDYPWIWYSR
jgi:putative transposase